MSDSRPSPMLPLAVLLGAAELTLAECILRFGPNVSVPMHTGFNGVVDRYGGRSEVAGLLVGAAIIGGLSFVVLEAMRRRSMRPRAFVTAQVVLLIAFGLIGALQAGQVFGAAAGLDVSSPRFHMATLAVLFTAVGAFLGKVPQNPLVGVRTYWSLSSRLAWEKSNRLGGRLLFWFGVAGLLAAPFAPEPRGFQALILAAALTAALCVFESWRVWRFDPERAAY
jgi:uncharacterized membrane protein